MGSHSYTERLTGPDLDAAFAEARETDHSEYGYSGYTGTIGQASGKFKITTRVCHPDEAERLGQLLIGWQYDVPNAHDPALAGLSLTEKCRRIDQARAECAGILVDALGGAVAMREARRWDTLCGVTNPVDLLPAYVHEPRAAVAAIPVAAAEHFTETVHVVNLDMLAGDLAGAWGESVRIHGALASHLPAGARIAKVEVLEDVWDFAAEATPVDGEVTTRYQVVAVSKNNIRTVLPCPTHPTREEAVRAALTWAKTSHGQVYAMAASVWAHLEVCAIVQCGDGQALDRITRTALSHVVTYRVTTVTPVADQVPVSGWVVAGTSRS